MLYIQRITLTAMVAFIPISGLLWFGAPWSSSRAEFEITGTALLGEIRARFSDIDSVQASSVDSTAWLRSEEAAQSVIGSLQYHRIAMFGETGKTWGVKLRERMRVLACAQFLDGWRIDGRSLCAWHDDWLTPETQADRLEIIDERLAIHQSADGRDIEISFRAANPDVAASIVDAFGDRLVERHETARQDMRRWLVERTEAEFARREAMLEASLSESSRVTEDDEEISEFGLLRKLSVALTRARTELPAEDRHQLDRELEVVKAAVRDQLLGQAADHTPDVTTTKRTDQASAASAAELLALLGHAEWSGPAIIRRSATTDGFSLSRTAVIALILSLMTGIASSAIWPLLRRQSDQRYSFYASPYANPHWPNMRLLEQAEPEKAA
ncbi:MAG: hypothetical protein ACR2RA_16810 [Geminicoccaceae bacterium]